MLNIWYFLLVVSAKHGLTFLGYIFTIGGTYLLVSFGPNSHEKLLATNIVKLIIGWPVLLYLVRYFVSMHTKSMFINVSAVVLDLMVLEMI